MLANEITPEMERNINIIAWTCSALSMAGCIFTILTFCSSRSFRKPVTRLIFYASFGNMLTNVAMIPARMWIKEPWRPGCQMQGFFQQWFIPADVLWGFVMAANVYLTFYRHYDTRQLERMEVPYILICYGIPFVPALTYLFINAPDRGRLYGDAFLWCWVSNGWDFLRIATFYAPIWILIFLIFFIYARTGRTIYLNYKKMNAAKSRRRVEMMGRGVNKMKPITAITTEIRVETEESVVLGDTRTNTQPGSWTVQGGGGGGGGVGVVSSPTPYSVTTQITSDRNFTQREETSGYGYHEADGEDGDGDGDSDMIELTQTEPTRASTLSGTPRSSRTAKGSAYGGARGRAAAAVREAPNATWAYAKCAMLFFAALLIIYIPSTANRIYSLVHPGSVSPGLVYASVFVLPLQGFWNSLIYVYTNRRACRRLFGMMLDECRRVRRRERRQHHVAAHRSLYNVGSAQLHTTSRENKRISGARHLDVASRDFAV